MLDPEFFFDEELAQTEDSGYVRLFYQGLWCHCDDIHHTIPNKPGWLKAQIFPYEDVDVTKFWNELVRIGKLTPFTSENGNPFGYLKNFGKHQRIDKPSKSKYPGYPEAPEPLQEYSESPPAKEKRSKVKRSKEKETASMSFLSEIPEKDLRELYEKYEASATQIKRKAEDLKNYCLAKGKVYKNYRAFLENALQKDFGRRLQARPIQKVDTTPLSAEALARLDEIRKEVKAGFKGREVTHESV